MWIDLRTAQKLLRRNGKQPSKAVLKRWALSGKITHRRVGDEIEVLRKEITDMAEGKR